MSKIIAFIIAVAAMAATAYAFPAHAAPADVVAHGQRHLEKLAAEAEAVRGMDVAQRKAWRLAWAARISKEKNEHSRYAQVLDLLSIQHQALED
jgi:hypothetical protein